MPPPPPRIRRALAAGLAALLAAGPASAQLIGGGGLGGAIGGLPGGLPDLPRPTRDLPLQEAPTRPLTGAVDEVAGVATGALAGARRLAVQRLIREHPEAVETDDRGAPVVRGEVLALAPSPEALAAAERAGFRRDARITEPALGLDSVVLAAPPGMTAREAVRRLRALDPQGQYDFDHLYQEGGAGAGPAGPAPAPRSASAAVKLGLVDGSAAAGHPALRSARLIQQAFAPGGARVTPHATAVASLLIGSAGRFRGGAPGSTLLVADVYGPTPAGGSAAAIVRGLAWLARNEVPVVNISLVGPPNLLLEAAVRGLAARGVLLVAAVGNDGPAAAPLYPAAYPGVVAVTAVDPRRKVLPEAGRGPNVAFAAPGAQMAAAGGPGLVTVRGTSFAAPLVAGELAQELGAPDPRAAALALQRLALRAQDLGARGRDPVFGFGLVAFDRRTDPADVGARGIALRGP